MLPTHPAAPRAQRGELPAHRARRPYAVEIYQVVAHGIAIERKALRLKPLDMLLNVTLIGLDGLCVEAAFARAARQVRLERLPKRPVKTLPAQVVDAVCTPFAPLRPAFLGLASILVRLLERYLCVVHGPSHHDEPRR